MREAWRSIGNPSYSLYSYLSLTVLAQYWLHMWEAWIGVCNPSCRYRTINRHIHIYWMWLTRCIIYIISGYYPHSADVLRSSVYLWYHGVFSQTGEREKCTSGPPVRISALGANTPILAPTFTLDQGSMRSGGVSIQRYTHNSILSFDLLDFLYRCHRLKGCFLPCPPTAL
jgi:hypothetical protein